MKDYRLHVPEGFKDVIGKDVIFGAEIEKRITKVFSSFGYEMIKTPLVEYTDIYEEEAKRHELYNLINREGEVLALTNDMTSSITRYVAANYGENLKLEKFSYISDVFRYPRMYQGKEHFIRQAGCEIISKKFDITLDAEMILLAYKILKEIGLNKFTIHLGSCEFLSYLLDDYKLDDKTKKIVFSSIKGKDFVSLRNILNEKLSNEDASFILSIIMKGGHLRYLEELMTNLKGKKSFFALEYLKKLFKLLNDLGIDNILFDFSINSYASYYTGIIFKVYGDGIKNSIITGGRSSKLYDKFGYSLTDIGFGIDIISLTSYAIDNNLYNFDNVKFISYQDEKSLKDALIKIDDMREDNISISIGHFDSLSDALSYAKENDFNGVLDCSNGGLKILEVK